MSIVFLNIGIIHFQNELKREECASIIMYCVGNESCSKANCDASVHYDLYCLVGFLVVARE